MVFLTVVLRLCITISRGRRAAIESQYPMIRLLEKFSGLFAPVCGVIEGATQFLTGIMIGIFALFGHLLIDS